MERGSDTSSRELAKTTSLLWLDAVLRHSPILVTVRTLSCAMHAQSCITHCVTMYRLIVDLMYLTRMRDY